MDARQMITRLRAAAAVCLTVVVLAFSGEGTLSAATECSGSVRVFAVDDRSGHLVQIRICSGGGVTFSPAVDVDSADWRAYLAVFAVADDEAVILYAVTAAGELRWWRQEHADGGLGASARIGDTVDWRHDVVFAARPGYLEVGDYDMPMYTFRHDGWVSGGAAVVDEGQLFSAFHGPGITAVAPDLGYAVGVWDGVNYRVWRESGVVHDDAWYASGSLPVGVSDVTGDGTLLYGLAADGGVVQLRQRQSGACHRFMGAEWFVRATAPGRFSRVVVPVSGGAGPPAVGSTPPLNPLSGPLCGGGGSNQSPWEWQG
jgi:hypothetical protein